MTVKLTFKGIVQGIGFRPTAQRLALEYGVKGQIKNSGGSVELIISKDLQTLDKLIQRLVSMFEIKSFEKEEIEDMPFDDFKIVSSSKDLDTPFITPDLATCPDCENELKSSENRRFHHPFISCINCGPRYTIINNLPYDRENITMSDFEMCKSCQEEYTTPSDRRCHAQTIACNDCGPVTNITVDEAVKILKNGKILAIKDIGGYHLACRADKPKAINEIRKIKGREEKPFAVMFSSLEEIEEYCFVNEKEKELLLSSARPIVLLEKKKDFDKSVCGESDYIGAFLPCNPLQILILDRISPLVMTSANISGEPIIIDDREIKKFDVDIIFHNREILTPLDDSILKVTAGRVQFIRRARGYVPLAIEIEKKAKNDTLCLGGDLKSAFAFHRDNYVFMSQHFGDLEETDVLTAYKNNINRFADLHSFKAEKVVADKHPNYYSSNLFENDLTVQHHKAHIASVIAEHKLKGKVLGFAFDGTGYGDDSAIWGSEVFVFDENSNDKFERKEHLAYTKMPASDEISKNADLALACYLGGNDLIEKAVKNNINSVNSSSMGRLFDAVCALLDIKHYNKFEGECACALESTARKAKKAYPIEISLNPVDILTQIKNANVPKEDVALGFHMMICKMILMLCEKYKKSDGINQIVLSGGTFNNKIITENTIKLLEEKGFDVYINERVPCGDGGLALGQAFIAAMEE
ncbi:MAG: carbamoyltransferase HypF [Eubacterium sp.]